MKMFDNYVCVETLVAKRAKFLSEPSDLVIYSLKNIEIRHRLKNGILETYDKSISIEKTHQISFTYKGKCYVSKDYALCYELGFNPKWVNTIMSKERLYVVSKLPFPMEIINLIVQEVNKGDYLVVVDKKVIGPFSYTRRGFTWHYTKRRNFKSLMEKFVFGFIIPEFVLWDYKFSFNFVNKMIARFKNRHPLFGELYKSDGYELLTELDIVDDNTLRFKSYDVISSKYLI